MFTTAADFEIPPYAIPNIDTPETPDDDTFQDFVDEQEEAELRCLLGDVLYDQFIAGLAVLPAEDIEVKWIRLRDGYTYSYGGKTRTYKGLRKLLKPYIWFMWMREEEIKKTAAGGSLAVAENSERVSLARELARGYNEYASLSGFVFCDKDEVNTLYGFLKAGVVDYPDWSDCSEIEYMNDKGL